MCRFSRQRSTGSAPKGLWRPGNLFLPGQRTVQSGSSVVAVGTNREVLQRNRCRQLHYLADGRPNQHMAVLENPTSVPGGLRAWDQQIHTGGEPEFAARRIG